MLSKNSISFQRPYAAELARRLAEERQFIQVVSGPRQVGKSTLVQSVLDAQTVPTRFVSADEPLLRGSEWISQQWEAARLESRDTGGAILALDEIQKISGWSETIKRLWDEDTRSGRMLKVILLGSAPLLIARGLSESLAGRFEILRLPHWSFSEMRQAFGLSLDEYVFYGGYPGSASLIAQPARWKRYINDSLIETTISRDVLLLTRVDKPALLRRVFELACRYSGQILSYTKMLGQLQDAGNTTTLAHYLDLLAAAGMVRGLPKYAGDVARSRASSPKLQVLNTSLMSAVSDLSFEEAKNDSEYWGRLVESAVGAHLANAESIGEIDVSYWREGNREVDFVLKAGKTVTAIEVKSGRGARAAAGLAAFRGAFGADRSLLVGGDGISLETFLGTPVEQFAGQPLPHSRC